MNRSVFIFLLTTVLLCSVTSAQSFRKGYRKLTRKKDESAASTIFKKHLNDRYGAGSMYYLTRMDWARKNRPSELFALDSTLKVAARRYAELPHKTADKQSRKYHINGDSILFLRRKIQSWMITVTGSRGSVLAMDTFLMRFRDTLPELIPMLDSIRSVVVNGELESPDYQVITSIVHHHSRFITPANFARSRGITERVWKLFQEQYTLCQLDRFAADYPRSVVGRDCWHELVRLLLCSGSPKDFLNFHLQVPWSALEFTVINAVLDSVRKEPLTGLDSVQALRLKDMQQVYSLFGRAHDEDADTLHLVREVGPYVARNAPHFSAFELLKETVKRLIDKKAYSSAVNLLQNMRPFFTDSLPASCKSNFDFQVRARPYIDGQIPLLQKQEPVLHRHSMEAVNTPEGDEFSPVMAPDGNTLYFGASGRKDNLDGQDVFVSYRKSEGWTAPILVPALSGKGNQVPLSITGDGRQFLVLINGKPCISRRKQNGDWGPPQALTLSGLAVTGRAVFSADGKTIILEGADFSGNAFKGPDQDLYYTQLDSTGHWTPPEGLGAGINTEGSDGNPYLSADGRTLYYTTSEYPGLGESDVFQSTRTGDSWTSWSRPVNLGKSINTIFNHQGFGSVTPDGKHAWYADYGRDGAHGDIWETELPENQR
jgi:hypothetical protein